MGFSASAQAAAGALPFVFFLAVAAIRFAQGADRPRALIDGFLALALVGDLGAEALGGFGAIAFPPVFVLWAVAVAAALGGAIRWRARLCGVAAIERPLGFYIVAVFAAATLLIALTAAPNNWDSQGYHLPRIEHWVQDGSLAFYPAANPRQNAFGPLAELLLLQTRVLSGGNAWYLLFQWLSMAVGVAAAFRIARQLGGTPAQGWIAAVFVATLPIGILESTSTQNDYVEAALLAAFVSLGIEALDRRPAPLGLVAAAACAGALSGLTKPIAFMLGVGFALWFAVGLSRGVRPAIWLRRLATAAAVLALVVGPFAARFFAGANLPAVSAIELPAGFGVGRTLDTLLRHVVSDLATGIPAIDAVPVRLDDWLADRLGWQAHRADTTDPEHPVYLPPKGPYIYHEDYGPNQLHAVLLALALIAAALRWPDRPTARQLIYGAAWVAGLLVFASLIRFGLWEVRYHLPGFVLAAPIVALRWPARGPRTSQSAVLLLVLAVASFPALLFNKSRELVPLWRAQFPALPRDQQSYLTQTPLERLFANRPSLLEPYRAALDIIAASHATQIGLVLDQDAWEYPVWWMLRQRGAAPGLRIEQVLVPDATGWPLGPFAPEILFWDRGGGEAPATLTVGGRQFHRIEQQFEPLVGRTNAAAVFAPTDPE